MNDMIEFRTAFRGYSKEDVNRYIEEVNRRFADAEALLCRIDLIHLIASPHIGHL